MSRAPGWRRSDRPGPFDSDLPWSSPLRAHSVRPNMFPTHLSFARPKEMGERKGRPDGAKATSPLAVNRESEPNSPGAEQRASGSTRVSLSAIAWLCDSARHRGPELQRTSRNFTLAAVPGPRRTRFEHRRALGRARRGAVRKTAPVTQDRDCPVGTARVPTPRRGRSGCVLRGRVFFGSFLLARQKKATCRGSTTHK